MKKLFLPLFFLVFCSLCVKAQQNFVKGYIVTTSGDTIQGVLNNKDWLKNPSYISFKNTSSSNVNKYYPLQVKSFGINTGEIYESHSISMDVSPHIEMNIFAMDNTVSKNVVIPDTTVFLTVLVKGEATLYSFFDANSKPHFYFSKKGENSIEELILQKAVYYKNDVKFIGESKIYQDQLMALSDCKDLQDFKNVQFLSENLIPIFIKYNKCVGFQSSKIIRNNKNKNQFYVLGGVSFNQTDLGAPINSVLPMVGIGIDYIAPRDRNRLRIGLEGSYQSSGKRDINFTNYIKINALVKYQILVDKPINPYLTVGYGITVTLNSDTNKNFGRTFDTSGLLFGVGFIKNRISVEARYESVGSTMNYLYGALSANNCNLFLRYHIF